MPHGPRRSAAGAEVFKGGKRKIKGFNHEGHEAHEEGDNLDF
jgi:hypothetical protein